MLPDLCDVVEVIVREVRVSEIEVSQCRDFAEFVEKFACVVRVDFTP